MKEARSSRPVLRHQRTRCRCTDPVGHRIFVLGMITHDLVEPGPVKQHLVATIHALATLDQGSADRREQARAVAIDLFAQLEQQEIAFQLKLVKDVPSRLRFCSASEWMSRAVAGIHKWRDKFLSGCFLPPETVA